MQRFVIRTDASLRIGAGHTARCLALAHALRSGGHAVRFVCREHQGNLVTRIEAQGFAASILPGGAPSAERDADETRRAIETAGTAVDWLIVDHYALDALWERRMADLADRILVIDDLANRPHQCDVLLDVSAVAHPAARYAGRCDATTTLLLGPQYALVDRRFAALRAGSALRRGPVRRILVSFGGADPQNVTARAIEAFLRLGRDDIRLDVALQSGMAALPDVQELAARNPRIHLHVDLPDLAGLMEQADIALGACGQSAWERLCLGLPSLVVTIADNQRATAAELTRRGVIAWIGDADEAGTQRIFEALDPIVRDGLDPEWSRRCRAEVDGLGAQRIAAHLTFGAHSSLALRVATAHDERLLLAWANDPLARRNSLAPAHIDEHGHHEWLGARLQRPDSCRIYVAETDAGVPVGHVRFEREAGAWTISFSIGAMFRGRGAGRRTLAAAIERLAEEHPGGRLRALVRTDNAASLKIFEALGFSRSAERGEVSEFSRQVAVPASALQNGIH